MKRATLLCFPCIAARPGVPLGRFVAAAHAHERQVQSHDVCATQHTCDYAHTGMTRMRGALPGMPAPTSAAMSAYTPRAQATLPGVGGTGAGGPRRALPAGT